MIDQIADKVVRGYIREVCSLLEFDEANVRLLYVPKIEQKYCIPQYAAITDDGCLVIDEAWANEKIKNETPTLVRCEVYCKVRMLYRQAKTQGYFSQYDINSINDAMAFNYALQTMKGLTLPMPPHSTFVKELLEHSKQILKDEFGLDTQYYKIPKEFVKDENVWNFRLTTEAERKYAESLWPKSFHSTVRVIDSTEKGTEGNPFEDVNEAFEYISNLEKDAYKNDELLNDIAAQQYFYDLNFHQFRVPWACPYVSFYNDADIPSNGFIVNQNQPHPDMKFHFTLKPNLQGKKFLYRGQSQDYPKPCTPNIFRDETKSYFLDDIIWSQEMELLLQTHPLVKLLEEGVEIMHDHFSILMNLGGLAQHYYHKTRFLDLTSDVDAAKFFATTNYCSKTDEYMPVHDTDKLGLIYCYELQMPFAFIPHKDYELSVIGKQVFMRSGAQHGFLLGMNRGMDLKKMPQVKKFFFRHRAEVSDDIYRQSDYGHRYFTMDILEEAWKEEYKKRLEDGIVSADTVRLNVSRNPGETFYSICKKLNEKGIVVDNTYHPHFAPDLLDKYYKSIKEGWWEDFCSDIYFYGGDNALYKDCLMRIPKREEYKWAFEK